MLIVSRRPEESILVLKNKRLKDILWKITFVKRDDHRITLAINDNLHTVDVSEVIELNDDAITMVSSIGIGNQIKIGVDAPYIMPVYREELYERILKSTKLAEKQRKKQRKERRKKRKRCRSKNHR